MNRQDKNKLHELLIEWFKEADFGKTDFLNQNKIAKVLKHNLDYLGYWRNKKNKRRGRHLREFQFGTRTNWE